jgi:tRNA U34 2-thiouridine synthase MnmA/TrmU
VEAEGPLYVDVDRARVKLRHRAEAVMARVARANGGFALELEEPAYAVARGQVAALYDGDAVVGAGVVVNAR